MNAGFDDSGSARKYPRASQVSPASLGNARSAGLAVMPWTINDPDEMQLLLNLGVDGLITDRPALARRVIAQHEELTPAERLLIDFGGRFGILEGGWESSEHSEA